jgi:hypothetical protein
MRSRLLPAIVLAAVAAAPRLAQARFLDLHVGLRAGGLTGRGSGSSPERRDFFERVRGPAAGFELGVKLLVLDLSLSFTQVLGGKGEIGDPGRPLAGRSSGVIGEPGESLGAGTSLGTGTLTTLLLGFEMEFKLPAQLLLRPRVAGGFGLGTQHPFAPPLRNDDVSHKGLVAEAQVPLEHYFNPFLAAGVEVAAGFHYFLGGNLVVNDSQNWSSGLQFRALLALTAHLGI